MKNGQEFKQKGYDVSQNYRQSMYRNSKNIFTIHENSLDRVHGTREFEDGNKKLIRALQVSKEHQQTQSSLMMKKKLAIRKMLT